VVAEPRLRLWWTACVGLEICRLMRTDPQLASTPIIMLTARADEEDRVKGLELGADDYVTKPFSPKELVARVNAVLRRTKRDGPDKVLRFGPLVVDLDRHEVTEGGRMVRLTAKEFLPDPASGTRLVARLAAVGRLGISLHGGHSDGRRAHSTTPREAAGHGGAHLPHHE
jgi:response regulator RpfG family c-di-GMP phosphodiesterase